MPSKNVDVQGLQNIWSSIFEKDTWLRTVLRQGHHPLLMGGALYRLRQKDNGPYIYKLVLTCYPKLHPDDSSWYLLLECLKKPQYESRGTVSIISSEGPMIDVVINELNPSGKRYCYSRDLLINPKKISDRLDSAYTYWEDSHAQRGYTYKDEKFRHGLRRLGPWSVEKVSKGKYDIGIDCELSLKDPDEKREWLVEMTFPIADDGEEDPIMDVQNKRDIEEERLKGL